MKTIRAALSSIGERITREPVLFFGAGGLWAAAIFHIRDNTPVGLALAATVLYLQRAYSTSRRSADENAEASKYVGAVEQQAAANTAPPRRTLRAE